jgi:hypothetical protein
MCHMNRVSRVAVEESFDVVAEGECLFLARALSFAKDRLKGRGAIGKHVEVGDLVLTCIGNGLACRLCQAHHFGVKDLSLLAHGDHVSRHRRSVKEEDRHQAGGMGVVGLETCPILRRHSPC